MDFTEKNELVNQIEKLLKKAIRSNEFHASIAIEKDGDGFAFSISSLNRKSTFESCSVIISGIGQEAKELSDKFKIPPDTKLKKPVEYK